MKTVTIASYLLGFVAVAGVIAAPRVLADQDQNQGQTSQEQSQQLEVEIDGECEQTTTTTAYGQTTTTSNCDIGGIASGEQEQKQVLGAATQVVFKDGEAKDGELFHKPVDTALDPLTTAAASGIMAVGAGAYAVKRKLR